MEHAIAVEAIKQMCATCCRSSTSLCSRRKQKDNNNLIKDSGRHADWSHSTSIVWPILVYASLLEPCVDHT